MAAPVPEPPALARSPEEEQHGSHEPGHILAQLSAALENPDIKALEWSEDGQGVLVHAELYEEEMGKNKELFPELADLGCVMLQAWLLAYGFQLKGTEVNSQVLLLQHPDFQRTHPTAKEPGALGGNADVSAMQQKKRKRKRRARSLHPRSRAMSQDTLGKRPRLRPLYQYINVDMLELMHPSEEDEVPELPQPSQVPAAPRRATAPWLQNTWASSTPEIPGAVDEPMQVDRTLRYTAHLVQLLFPQYQ